MTSSCRCIRRPTPARAPPFGAPGSAAPSTIFWRTTSRWASPVGFGNYYSKGIDATSGGTVTFSNAAFSFGPRVGANFSIGPTFSLYPQFTLDIAHQAYDELAGNSENQSANDIVSVDFFVPLLVHPAPHVFLGLGPHLYHEVSNAVTFPNNPLAPATQNRETTVGAAFVLGDARIAPLDAEEGSTFLVDPGDLSVSGAFSIWERGVAAPPRWPSPTPSPRRFAEPNPRLPDRRAERSPWSSSVMSFQASCTRTGHLAPEKPWRTSAGETRAD